MADNYIDAFEAVTYGQLAVREIRGRVIPLHADWRGALERAIALQIEKNERLAALTGRIQRPKLDAQQIAEVKDSIVRFGSWLDSLKGRPLDPARFFGTSAPSVVADRRVSKVAGQLEQMVGVLAPYAEGEHAVDGAAGWLGELRTALALAVAQRDAQRDGKVSRAELGPEIEQARLAWLSTYTANKRLVEGILRHEGKEALMPIIFDDLAEVQRTSTAGDAGGDGLEHLTTGGEGPTNAT